MSNLVAMSEAAERAKWERTTVCTANYPGGWNYGACYGSGVYELHIFRVENGKIVRGPHYGKKWKYHNSKLSASQTLRLIERVCEKLGLACGALKIYSRKPV